MKPWEIVEQTVAPGGERLTLVRHDGELLILAGGKPLMSSREHGSEEALARLACRHLVRSQAPNVLIGGLGMGFTVRAALDLLPRSATVVVAELVAGVAAWSSDGPVGEVARHPLRDSRVRLEINDVLITLESARRPFDVILLDVDNGPDAFTSAGNAALYGPRGLSLIRSALKPDGVLAVWSAWNDRSFAPRLERHGFTVTVEPVSARANTRGGRHTVFIARLRRRR